MVSFIMGTDASCRVLGGPGLPAVFPSPSYSLLPPPGPAPSPPLGQLHALCKHSSPPPTPPPHTNDFSTFQCPLTHHPTFSILHSASQRPFQRPLSLLSTRTAPSGLFLFPTALTLGCPVGPPRTTCRSSQARASSLIS